MEELTKQQIISKLALMEANANLQISGIAEIRKLLNPKKVSKIKEGLSDTEKVRMIAKRHKRLGL